VSGGRAAALLLVGVLIGGVSGGAAATYLTYRAAQPPGQSAPTSVGLPIATAPPSSSGAAADDEIVGVVQDLLPSVVTVINYAANGQPQSSGSGFVVDAAKGYVVTNNHVVEDPRTTGTGASFDVVFSSDKKTSAKLIGRDPFTDLAVLQVAAQGLKAATLANSDNVPVGALTVAIGSPLGEFQNTVTHGIVSAKGRRVAETSQVVLEDLIQTDAPINPGNSGGPLLWAATHQVIGVNTLGVTQATGINFAVSSNTVKQIADEIIANGRVIRGSIGIQYSPVTTRQAAQLGLPTGTIGIVVTQVVPGSPAEQAGIQVNDIITKVNDQVIDADHPLSSLLVKNRPGDKVKLTLIRNGREMTVEVTLGQPPQ
jgi:S1-C subfamily serine protease